MILCSFRTSSKSEIFFLFPVFEGKEMIELARGRDNHHCVRMCVCLVVVPLVLWYATNFIHFHHICKILQKKRALLPLRNSSAQSLHPSINVPLPNQSKAFRIRFKFIFFLPKESKRECPDQSWLTYHIPSYTKKLHTHTHTQTHYLRHI